LNYNGLSLALEYCYAPQYVFSGNYRVIPAHPEESGGTVSQSGSYAGFIFGYAHSWGKPKRTR
jgi:hypothetical protein